MSLRVWLPLTGHLNNQGLADITVTNSGATLDSNGKLGGCYYFNGNNNYITATNYANLGNTFTVSMWFNSTAVNGDRGLCCDRTVPYAGFTAYLSNGKLIIDPCASSYGSSTRWTTSFTATANTWYHLVIIRTPTDISYYVNGVLGQSKSVAFADSYGNCFSIGAFQRSGASYGTYYYGKINDVRIYDHALSAKEIKLLSQGLVCHYPLNQPFSLNNLVRNYSYVPYNNFSGSGSTATVVKTGTYNNCDIYRLTYTPNDTSLSNVQNALSSHGIYGFIYTFKANTKYAFWILWKPISHPDTICGGTASNIGGWTEIPNRYFGDGWYEVGQYRNGTVTTDKRDNIFVSFKCPSATSGTPIIIDFCCPHLIEGYDYIMLENSYQLESDTCIYDCSGFGHTGIISGELTTSSDTPRNSISTTFDRSQHINTTIVPTGYANSYTFAWWGKFGNCNGTMMWGFANGNRLNLYCYTYNCYWNTGNVQNNPFGVALSDYLDDKFHHFAVTGDGTTAKLYIDGEFKANATTYQGITGTNLYFNGWAASSSYNFNGGLSDFRLYATALSAEDIQQLYNAPESISNSGGIFTQGEFIES